MWCVVVMNLFIHVVMYGYYAAYALGYRPWWKRYLTTMQISQFVLSLVACVTTGFMGTFTSYSCHGSKPEGTFGAAILASYLVLFIQLYHDTYKSKKQLTQTLHVVSRRKATKKSTKKSSSKKSSQKKSSSKKKPTPKRASSPKRRRSSRARS